MSRWLQVIVTGMFIAVCGGTFVAADQYDGQPIGDGNCLYGSGGGKCCDTGGGSITCYDKTGKQKARYSASGECGDGGYENDTDGDGVFDSCHLL